MSSLLYSICFFIQTCSFQIVIFFLPTVTIETVGDVTTVSLILLEINMLKNSAMLSIHHNGCEILIQTKGYCDPMPATEALCCKINFEL